MIERRLSLDVKLTLADKETRTIEGIAIPNDSADLGLGKPVRFAMDSITFDRENIPLLAYHDANRPVGKLTAHEWNDEGWTTKFKVSNTNEGTDILTLANDGVLGLSVGVLYSPDDIEETEEEFVINQARCFEISATPVPVFAGATINKVQLSQKVADMPEAEDTVLDVADGTVTEEPIVLTAAMPAVIPTPKTRAKASVVYPHLFGLPWDGSSFLRDLALSRGMLSPKAKDAGYSDRLEELRFAVNKAKLPPQDPQADRSLDVVPRDPSNPLSGKVTTRTLTSDAPFYVLTRVNGDTNLDNPHVEGVEPVLGDIGAWTRALVTPGYRSGKVAITREAVLSDASPDMESLVFQRFEIARRNSVESAISTALGAVTLPAGQIHAVNSGADLEALAIQLMYSIDAERFTTVLAGQQLYAKLAGQKDSAGRPLYPMIGPSNANGTTGNGFTSMQIGGFTVVPVAGMANAGYLVDPTIVISWTGNVNEWVFDYEVAWVRLGHMYLSATAITDTTGVHRLTTT
jgi:HK97 family phage prohead protease